MIPRTRLICWAAGVLLPFAAVTAAPGLFAPAAFVMAAFVILVITDAAWAPGRLDGLRVEIPAVVRLQNGRRGTIPFRIHNESAKERVVRVGVAFPREISTEEPDWTVKLPEGTAESTFSWPCLATRRGQYPLHQVHLEAVSPLGFWAARVHRPLAGELRVYPDLFSERRQAAALFLRQATGGIHTQRAAGQGREFEKLREFIAGDSLSDIHWKASAKRGKPVTKVHQIERSHEVYVVIDASRLSARKISFAVPAEKKRASSGDEESGIALADNEQQVETTALERYVTAALLLALAAERQGDQFGLVTFSDRVLSFVRARSGQAHFDACRDRLYRLHSQDVSPDFEELCTFIRLRLRKRSLVIFLTSLEDPILAKSFEKATDLIRREQLIFANMLQPAEAQPLFDEKSVVSGVDDLYRRLGGHLQWSSLRELQKGLQRRGVRLSFLDPQKISAELIAQHTEVRTRQLL